MLKGTDHELFDAIAKTGKYILGLSPITLSGETDEGAWDRSTYVGRFTEPIERRYRWDNTTRDVISKRISKDHVFISRLCEYIVSNREASKMLQYSSYKEYTGNEAEEGRFKYFLGVIVVARK